MGTADSGPAVNNTPALLRDILTDALRYWEWRRIAYNAVLAIIVVYFVIASWAQIHTAVRWVDVLRLLVLAVLANVCYSAAYVADIAVQLSGFQAGWRKRRWVLWGIGTLFAATLAMYWMGDEIVPAIIGS